MNRLQFEAALEGLTPRRRQVLKLVLAGVSDRAIAQSLTIETSTVRKHIENLCRSFGIENEFPDDRTSKRPELVALFAQYQPDWVKTPLTLLTQPSAEPSVAYSLLNREVYILVDQSGSMVRKDPDTGHQTRYEYLAEIVEGHCAAILAHCQEERSICDRLTLHFFSRQRTPPAPLAIDDPSKVHKLFIDNQPKTKTFIAPPLEHCINHWITQENSPHHGAFFIIYTDGQFDDEVRFIDCLKTLCQHIDCHSQAKVIVLGLGEDIDIEHFLTLDFNLNQTMSANIFVFDLVNEVDDIIELLSRQLTESPHLAFPEWVKVRYPHLVDRALSIDR